MSILAELRDRFRPVLTDLVEPVDDYLQLIRPSQDPRFGDYQANLAMPLGKRLGRPPREVAQAILDRLQVNDFCHPPEIAGPGFINFRVRESWLESQLSRAVSDERLGISSVSAPRTFVIDYSAPNVAKPMHVGHIRSTVIGNALYRTLKFLGHTVIGDNHIGDWGTQFGMIILGWKEFRDESAYAQNPVDELARLYRLVNGLIDYYDGQKQLPKKEALLAELSSDCERMAASRDAQSKEAQKELAQKKQDRDDVRRDLDALRSKLAAAEADAVLGKLIRNGGHQDVEERALQETARLHAGDAENRRLWEKFLPPCLAAINRVYERLGVRFDETLGESFYHDRLPQVVQDLLAKKIARESEGAVCIFFEGQVAPMIVRKKDGAFLYATTDLATIQYRLERWHPDAILYVVDHRQSLHFEQLFQAARLWGIGNVELAHVGFGTVLGSDGRPFKTRSGDTVGLWGLLDEAVTRAMDVIRGAEGESARIADEDRERVAEVVGIGALKYADLAQNRTSDYTFSYEKMLAMNGNTATYMQYAYARVRSIFAKGEVDIESLRQSAPPLRLAHAAERSLALELLRFADALDAVATDYRPHHLTAYLYELAGRYSTFFEECPVLKAPDEATRVSRLLLCDLTARTLRLGLALLGIDVVEKM